jgi:hypothetical protein
MRFGELVKNLSSEARELDSESIARTCEAVDQVQLSKAATRHAIEQSRKSLHETHALLVGLRPHLSRRRLRPSCVAKFLIKRN